MSLTRDEWGDLRSVFPLVPARWWPGDTISQPRVHVCGLYGECREYACPPAVTLHLPRWSFTVLLPRPTRHWWMVDPCDTHGATLRFHPAADPDAPRRPRAAMTEMRACPDCTDVDWGYPRRLRPGWRLDRHATPHGDH